MTSRPYGAPNPKIALCALLALATLCGCHGSSSLQAPVCSLDTSYLDFGTLAVGDSAERTFHVSNSGAGTLSGAVSCTNPAFHIVGTPSYNLQAGQSAAVTVRLVPVVEVDQAANLALSTSGCSVVSAFGHVEHTRDAFISVDASGPSVLVQSNIGQVKVVGSAVQGAFACGRGLIFDPLDSLRIYVNGDSVGISIPGSVAEVDGVFDSMVHTGDWWDERFYLIVGSSGEDLIVPLTSGGIGIPQPNPNSCGDLIAAPITLDAMRAPGSSFILLRFHNDWDPSTNVGVQSFSLDFKGWRIPIPNSGPRLFRGTYKQTSAAS
jgi:hypothetical protein